MSGDVAFKLMKQGMEAADRGDTTTALASLEEAARINPTPLVESYRAYCIARELGRFSEAEGLCREALRTEPANPLHYLNLGRILGVMGMKAEGLSVLRQGLKIERHPRLLMELRRQGVRRSLLLPFLDRTHPLNRHLGRMLAWARRQPAV